jgi:hypothetical protein
MLRRSWCKPVARGHAYLDARRCLQAPSIAFQTPGRSSVLNTQTPQSELSFPDAVHLEITALWNCLNPSFTATRRLIAMPLQAPKSLTDDQVDAVSAYILHLNGKNT